MYCERVVLKVDRVSFNRELVQAAFRAAGQDGAGPLADDLRIQNIELTDDGDTYSVTLVHHDVYDLDAASFDLSIGERTVTARVTHFRVVGSTG